MSRTEVFRRSLRYALWPTAFVLGIVAEWIGRPELAVLDTVTGFALFGRGLAAWSRRPRLRVGPILGIAGVAWFIGSLWPPMIYLHRGPLAHLFVSYPGRTLLPTSRLDRAAVVAAYAYAAAYPVARDDYATIAFALGLVALSARRGVMAERPQRQARLASFTAATVFGLVLAVAAVGRLVDVEAGRRVLVVYDLSGCLIALGLFADLLWGRGARATVTGLVVDLGEPATSGTLRDRLARTLGDPTLVVGYWLPEESRYVDEADESPCSYTTVGSSWTIPRSSLPSRRRRAWRYRTRGSRRRCASGWRRSRRRVVASSRPRTTSAIASGASSALGRSAAYRGWRSSSERSIRSSSGRSRRPARSSKSSGLAFIRARSPSRVSVRHSVSSPDDRLFRSRSLRQLSACHLPSRQPRTSSARKRSRTSQSTRGRPRRRSA